MDLAESKLQQCESALYQRLITSRRAKLLQLDTTHAAEIASQCMEWTVASYRRNLVGDVLKREIRKKFKDRYGALWTAILFAIVWEIIKHYLFET